MPDQLTITLLVDNQAGDGLIAEHGLSMWLEYQGLHILFDTGQSCVLEKNARKLGIDLNHADVLVLSHGHYDHTGGIPCVLGRNDRTEVYCHPGITRQRYVIRDGKPRSIQISAPSLSAISNHPGNKLHWTPEKTMLNDRIGITGSIPRTTAFEDTGGPFYLDTEGKHEDDIGDEIALWIETTRGLVICLGCSHPGMINTLNFICSETGIQDIYAIVGGFHLNSAGKQRIQKTIDALQTFSPENIIPCHCTGEYAMKAMAQHFGQRVLKSHSGMVYRF